MLELTGVASILRGIAILYWLLAVGALGLVLWKVKRRWHKSIGVLAVITIFGFLPAKHWIELHQRQAYAREAWAYFKKLCDEKSGEKIYKTFTGVKSVLVVKPLPPASDRDHFDQFWYGDPYSYSAHADRAEGAARRLIGKNIVVSKNIIGEGFDFVEIQYFEDNRSKYQRLVPSPDPPYYRTLEDIPAPNSRFGISWEDISTAEDRKYWVAASRLRAVDLTDNSTIAERIGYLIEAGFGSTSGGRRPWLAARALGQNGRSCPDAHDYSDRWFLLKVLRPTGATANAN